MSAGLFEWLQGADFYRQFHAEAAALVHLVLPDTSARSWLDLGCGPGLLTRLAAEHNFLSLGLDPDAAMIQAARRLAGKSGSHAAFEIGDLAGQTAQNTRFDVISASSLLVVLPQPALALRQMLNLCKPEGLALVLEAAPEMSRRKALLTSMRGGRRAYMLNLWAGLRSGNCLPDSLFYQPDLEVQQHKLLAGLVNCWLIRQK